MILVLPKHFLYIKNLTVKIINSRHGRLNSWYNKLYNHQGISQLHMAFSYSILNPRNLLLLQYSSNNTTESFISSLLFAKKERSVVMLIGVEIKLKRGGFYIMRGSLVNCEVWETGLCDAVIRFITLHKCSSSLIRGAKMI